MTLYLLERDAWDYDEVVSCVVVASCVDEARHVAHDWEMAAQERDEFARPNVEVAQDWLDEKKSSVRQVPVSMSRARVVHVYVHHG